MVITSWHYHRAIAPRQEKGQCKLIDLLTNWIRERKRDKAFAAFEAQHEFTLNGRMGFSIHRLVVSEFGYLLRHVTDGKHDNFDNFTAIARDEREIDLSITKEINLDLPREAEVKMTTVEGARHNLENMRSIVHVIARYVEFAKEHGLSTDPLLAGKPTISWT